jgi:uncharacterized damage-inducible protein DinB
MRRIITSVALLLLLCAPLAADHHEGEGSAYGTTLAADFEAVSGKLVQLAEAMPEETFSWRPAEGVRSTSEVIMHVVGADMLMPTAFGAAPPAGLEIPENPFSLARQWEATVTSKAEVIAKLKQAVAYTQDVLANFPQAQLDDEVNLFGRPFTKRAGLLILLTHSHEHLGQLIAYARSNGVTPPWSRPLPQDMPEEGGEGEGDAGADG